MLNRSLLRHQLAWALGALLLVWLSFIALAFKTGLHEADELTDGHLASIAALLVSQRGDEFITKVDAGDSVSPELKRHDYQQSMSIVVWDTAGRLITRSGEAPVPPFGSTEGFADLDLGEPRQPWRGFTRWDGPAHGRKVMVLLKAQEREDLARDIAGQIAEPGLWLLPVVALALGLAIRRGLQPLHELSRDVHALDVSRAAQLPARHPQREFAAVVESVNTLVERQHAALLRERQLASELAHELRTPLASLALNARHLRGLADEAEREGALQRIEHDALRAGEVVTQLLALARASRTELAEAAQPLDLAALARRVVAEYAQTAVDTGHELGLAGSPVFPLSGHPVLLELALRNLLDNALGHTPPGTAVEVQIDAAQRWLQVCDNGVGARVPAAPPSAASPALPLGLGLGHRVVEKVASIHDAAFAACAAPAGFSACYRLTFVAG